MKFAILGCTLLLLTSACQQEVQPVEVMLASHPTTVYGPYKGTNPADSTGIYHNDACEALFSYYTTEDTTLTACFEAMAAGGFALLQQAGLNPDQEDASKLDSLADEVEYWVQNDLPTIILNYTDSTYLSSIELGYLHRCAQAADQVTSLAELKDSITLIEGAITASNLPSDALIYPLISVFKHSTYFWENVYNGSFLKGIPPGFGKENVNLLQMIVTCADMFGYYAAYTYFRSKGDSDRSANVKAGFLSSTASQYANDCIVAYYDNNPLPPLRSIFD